MKKIKLFIISFFVAVSVIAQSHLPIVKANSITASMREGNELYKDNWTIMPNIKPDIWEVNFYKNGTKKVALITDIDSISFEVEQNKTYNFIVLLNGKDTAYTQIKTIKTKKIDPLKVKSPYYFSKWVVSDTNFKWIVKTVNKNKFFYEKNSWAEKNINYIIAKQDSAIKNALLLIGEKKFNDSIYSFFFESNAKKNEATGDSGNAHFNGLATFYTCYNGKISFSNHELTHVVTVKKLGITFSSLMEGIAVYSDGDWNGKPLEKLSAWILENYPIEILQKFSIPNRDSLTFKKLFESWDAIPWEISYPLAGSMFKYLYKTYSLKQIKAIWKKPYKIEKITGKSFEQLDKEWKQFLKK